MGRFASDYLPLDGAQLFDMKGQMPPACRLLLQIPPEYTESPLADWFNPDELKDTLIERSRDNAQRALWTFRQGRNLGSIDIVRQSRQLDNGVFMDYRSQFGRETVVMMFSESLVREVFEETAGTCMLVYYGKDGANYKIAAIPMSKIDNPTSGDVIVNRPSTLTLNNPADFELLSCVQMKIAEDTHVVATHVGIDKSGVASVTGMPTSPLNYYNSKNTILGSTVATGIGNSFIQLNWSGKTVYDNNGSKVEFGPNNKITFSDNAPWINNFAMAVSETGGLYSQPNFLVIEWTHVTSWSGGFLSDAQMAQWVAAASPSGRMIFGGYGGPGEGDFTYQYVPGSITGGSGNVTLPAYINVYSNDGKLDKVTTISTPVTENGFYDPTTVPTSTFDLGGAMWELSGRINQTDTVGPRNLTINPGYALGASLADNWVNEKPWGPPDSGTAHTPFGVFGNSDYPTPAIWVANGKTYICKFSYYDFSVLNNVHKIYKDRKEYGSQLISAIGASSEIEVLVILLDIKLSDINKLK